VAGGGDRRGRGGGGRKPFVCLSVSDSNSVLVPVLVSVLVSDLVLPADVPYGKQVVVVEAAAGNRRVLEPSVSKADHHEAAVRETGR